MSKIDILLDFISASPTPYHAVYYTRSGSLVKRLRRRPLTAETGVRFSYGSPEKALRLQRFF